MMEYLILGIMEYWAGNGKKSFLIVLFSLNPTGRRQAGYFLP
jgi:hypothetical protein